MAVARGGMLGFGRRRSYFSRILRAMGLAIGAFVAGEVHGRYRTSGRSISSFFGLAQDHHAKAVSSQKEELAPKDVAGASEPAARTKPSTDPSTSRQGRASREDISRGELGGAEQMREQDQVKEKSGAADEASAGDDNAAQGSHDDCSEMSKGINVSNASYERRQSFDRHLLDGPVLV